MTASKTALVAKLKGLGETSDGWETKQQWQILAQIHKLEDLEIHKLEDLEKLRKITGRPYHNWESRPYEDIEQAIKSHENGDLRDLSTRLGSGFKRTG